MGALEEIKLKSLVEGIRADFQAIDTDNRSALTHAIDAGTKLIEAKKLGKKIYGPSWRWMPWVEENFPGHHDTANKYMRLAENSERILNFSSIQEALANLPKKQSRPRQRNDNGDDLWKDERVLAWTAARMKEGLNRDEIREAAKEEEHDWPLPGKRFPQNAVDRARAIIEDRKQKKRPAPEPESKKLRSKEGTARKRTTAQERKAAQVAKDRALVDLMKMEERLNEIVRVLETTDFASEFDLNDIAIDTLMRFADDLATTIDWCERAIMPVRGKLGDVKMMELIRKLENTTGRSDEEARAFRHRANILRRKHGLELVA
jgi:hypothetical protein